MDWAPAGGLEGSVEGKYRRSGIMKTRYASGIEPGLEKQDVAAGLLLALAGTVSGA